MAPAQMIEPKDLPPEVAVTLPAQHAQTATSALALATPSPAVGRAGAAPVQAVFAPASSLPPTTGHDAGHHPGHLPGDEFNAHVTPFDRTLPGAPVAGMAAIAQLTGGVSWELGLEAEAVILLAAGRHDVWDELTRRFESRLILTALANTKGRRIEAAQRLGIGRNTITRKIQELGL